MNDYNLGFIGDNLIRTHVFETVKKYRFAINLSDFNKNLIDPIKLTFDFKIYGKTIAEIIESEALCQIDKSNTNRIGYFLPCCNTELIDIKLL
ncbi:MAG: Eco47II family restriction endonuclease [Rickettsiales bacterium]|nr:Eco47II family restriction endonuclease [Rickettsiales bacterium]